MRDYSHTTDQIEAMKFVISVIAPVITGWLGLRFGLSQVKIEKRLAFIEKQLAEFYGPLLGMHHEIGAKSKMRQKVENTSLKQVLETLPETEWDRAHATKGEINYNNKQLYEELLPMYREMLKVFRDKQHLAEKETLEFYSDLVEFVEGWNRISNGGITIETLQEINHTEENLEPFYRELETRSDILRKELSKE